MEKGESKKNNKKQEQETSCCIRYSFDREEDEEERARIEGQKDRVYLDWFHRVKPMLSNKNKALVERAEDRVYIDKLLNNEDKAEIETSLSNKEYKNTVR